MQSATGSSGPVRVERFGRTSLFGYACGFICLFVTALLIGKLAGPKAFIEHDTDVHVRLTPALNDTQTEIQTAEVSIGRMVPKFQLLYVYMQLEKPGWGDHTLDSETIVIEQNLSVVVHKIDDPKLAHNQIVHSQPHTRKITCRAHERYCDHTRVFYNHFIDHHNYKVLIHLEHAGPMYKCQKAMQYTGRFAIVYVSREYTEFEIGWKYAFLGTTLATMLTPRCGFFPKLCQRGRAQWSSQQQWVSVLLILLLAFNDPFFLASIFAPPKTRIAFVSVHIVGAVTFVSVLLNFWIKILTDTKDSLIHGWSRQHQGSNGSRSSAPNWIARTLLSACFFASTLGVYFYEFMNQFEDPAYSSLEDMGKFKWVWYISALLTGVYCFWLLFLFWSIGAQLHKLEGPFVFVFFLTAVAIVVAMAGIYIGCLSWVEHSSVIFLGFSAIFNLYVWTLAFAFAPAPRDVEYSRQGGMGSHSHGAFADDDQVRIDFQPSKHMPGTPDIEAEGGGGRVNGGGDAKMQQVDLADSPNSVDLTDSPTRRQAV